MPRGSGPFPSTAPPLVPLPLTKTIKIPQCCPADRSSAVATTTEENFASDENHHKQTSLDKQTDNHRPYTHDPAHDWTRVVVEKPFGLDYSSAEEMVKELQKYTVENEVYRIDHYLGKEMVLNLFVLRFANSFFAPLWNRQNINAVRITFKEDIGTYGRGGYFDTFGVIRDVIQNHLLQIVSLVGMEPPVSLDDEHVRDEKVKLLRAIACPKLEECVLGQYTRGVGAGGAAVPGYLDDPTVPPDSRCATFVTLVLWINNERWAGVPFILKAGKALETRTAEIRIQLKTPCNNLFPSEQLPPNELVLRIQPDDAIYMKCVSKRPGLNPDMVETELDLTMMDRMDITRINDAYERLLLDVIKGDKKNFVRTDELLEAWRIFDPLLHNIEDLKIQPELYEAGSHGPMRHYDMITRLGFKRSGGYVWHKNAKGEIA